MRISYQAPLALPQKVFPLLYCKGQTLEQTLGTHGCLVLTFLSSFISHHLPLFTCFSDLEVSPEYWEVSVPLLWSSVFCVEFYWPTSLPRGLRALLLPILGRRERRRLLVRGPWHFLPTECCCPGVGVGLYKWPSCYSKRVEILA